MAEMEHQRLTGWSSMVWGLRFSSQTSRVQMMGMLTTSHSFHTACTQVTGKCLACTACTLACRPLMHQKRPERPVSHEFIPEEHG